MGGGFSVVSHTFADNAEGGMPFALAALAHEWRAAYIVRGILILTMSAIFFKL